MIDARTTGMAPSPRPCTLYTLFVFGVSPTNNAIPLYFRASKTFVLIRTFENCDAEQLRWNRFTTLLLYISYY